MSDSDQILSFVERSRKWISRAPGAPLARDTASTLDEIVRLVDDLRSGDPVLGAKISILLNAAIRQISLMLDRLQ